jgi:hypothetical protein
MLSSLYVQLGGQPVPERLLQRFEEAVSLKNEARHIIEEQKMQVRLPNSAGRLQLAPSLTLRAVCLMLRSARSVRASTLTQRPSWRRAISPYTSASGSCRYTIICPLQAMLLTPGHGCMNLYRCCLSD